MKKILVIHNNSGSRHYRFIPQLRHLQQEGHQIMMAAHNDQYLRQRIDQSDVIVFQMCFTPELIGYAKKLGKRTIMEVDDLLHKVPPSHYSHKELSGWGSVRWLWTVWKCLRRCDGFICTTEELKKHYGWMCKKIIVYPNWCDLIHWEKEEKKNGGNDVRILWAGSTSHTIDLKFVEPIMRRVLEECPEAKFIYIGAGGVNTDDLYARFVYGEDIFKRIPTERRESMLPVPSVVWPYILNGLVADVGIAPLVDDEVGFARCKSQCKYIEYGINGIPAVYSRWFYTDVKDGKTGLVADTEDEWVEAIVRLVKNEKLRREIGTNAKSDIQENFDVRNHLKEWADFVLEGKSIL